ncbi:MAG: Holliday junction resolvase RuvX [Chitinophagaceae bacterium]
MARILSIDYGGKRTGIAVTDPMQIIANGLTTVDTKDIWTFLKNYFATERVEKVIIGLPTNWDDSDTHGTPLVKAFLVKFKKDHPAMPIETVDERNTSKMAVQSMIESGMKKKDRRNKKLVDEIAATIMLQDYMQRQ